MKEVVLMVECKIEIWDIATGMKFRKMMSRRWAHAWDFMYMIKWRK